VAHGASKVFNPTLPQRVIDRALEKDRAKATAEYLAEFRTDVEGFVTLRARVRRGWRLRDLSSGPTLPQRVIDRALKKDGAKATAEYLAEFRTDLEGFVTLRARVRRGGRSLL
jgi:ribosomal protein L15E